MGWELDLDVDSHEAQPQYQYHANLVPRHLNLKHETKYHHQMEMEECLYLLMLQIVVDQEIDLLQTEQCAL